jgi:hypothetical protein
VRETLNEGIITHGADAVKALQTAYIDVESTDVD